MIGRGADEGQAERDVDAFVEGDGLDRDQRLIVIHRKRGVIAGARPGVEHRVRRMGAARIDPERAQAFDRGADDGIVLLAQRAALAGMGIEAADRDARRRDAEAGV